MKTIYAYISRQFGHPTGVGGKISTFFMNCLNKRQYKTVVENLDLKETDTVLDIGFGNGHLIRRLSNGKRKPKKYTALKFHLTC